MTERPLFVATVWVLAVVGIALFRLRPDAVLFGAGVALSIAHIGYREVS